MVDQSQERVVSEHVWQKGKAGKRERSESLRPRFVHAAAVGILREKKRLKERPGSEREPEWESGPAE